MRHKESASTVVLSMIIIVVLAMCVACALDYTLQTFRYTQRTNARAQAINAATGALDLAFVQWREACRQQENSVLSAATITTGSAWSAYTSYPNSSGSTALPGSFMNIPGVSSPISVSLYALSATDPNTIAHPLPATATPVPSQTMAFAMPTYSYLAQATAKYSTLHSGTNSVTVSRVFQKVTESPWQYAIFYNGDLEMNPGATMAVTGAVQTNGNLYTGGSGGVNNLTFEGPVNYAKYWDPNGEFDPDETAQGNSTPVPPAGIKPTPGPAQLPQNSNVLGSASVTNGLQDGYHEIIEPWPPVTTPGVWAPSSATDPLATTTNPDGTTDPSEREFNQAGVKIMITGANRNNPTVTIYGPDGLAVSSTSTGIDKQVYNAFLYTTSNSVSVGTGYNASGGNQGVGTATQPITTNASNGTLYDSREGQTVFLTTLDIGKITTALNNSLAGTNPSCNVIYIEDTFGPMNQATPTGATNAIELINGANMPTAGLTIVSGNPVYVQGDYNTASAVNKVNSVNSNLSTSIPSEPYQNGYTPAPCAIMADAVTILSNSWSNAANKSNNWSMQNATNTTVNSAIMSGIVTSAQISGQSFTYSGGVENFPRFLENWDGTNFTYYGSMVELFNSMEGIGVWRQTGGYYNPPHRQWYFNVNFYTNPPPGTFKVISYNKSRWMVP